MRRRWRLSSSCATWREPIAQGGIRLDIFKRGQSGGPAGRDRRPGRPVGRRQVLAPAHCRLARGADRRRGVHRRAQLQRPRRPVAHPHPPDRHRLRLSVPSSAAGILGARERDHAAADRRRDQESGGRARHGAAGAARPRFEARSPPGGTVRRRAAAGGDRPGAGQPAATAPGRRADRQSRSA